MLLTDYSKYWKKMHQDPRHIIESNSVLNIVFLQRGTPNIGAKRGPRFRTCDDSNLAENGIRDLKLVNIQFWRNRECSQSRPRSYET